MQKVDRQAPPPAHNHVAELRKCAGMSQTALGEAAGTTRETISNIERYLGIPSLVLALHIARVLGTRVDELFCLEDHDSPAT